MKTVMIIDKDTRFSNRIKQSIIGEDISVITVETNRDALRHLMNEEDVDLFLIPAKSNDSKKRFFLCHSTQSLSTPLEKKNQLLNIDSSPNELKTVIKNHLSY